ncbi:GHKL domain-containing protein [Clostridium sp. LY3-2]|uniref:sensor histidine kinase n=1 Tax=Clostridium sp. LY3-2 TaxID=2942482 RepID=UPI002153012E|nr:GHKL domain-containing protein [Clostridium sp. LY3-2]MCR6514720.1 GHKL domain-containing protein [Clostridium sp. LY3-2]
MPIVTILEMLTTIIFRNIIVGEKKTKYLLVFFPVSIFIMFLNEYFLKYYNNMGIIIIMSLISFILYKVTKDDLIKVIIDVVFSTTVMLLGELIGYASANLLEVYNQWIILALAIIMWTVFGYILDRIDISNKLESIFKMQNSKVVVNILINSILVFLLFKSLNDKGLLGSRLVVEMTIYILIFITLTVNLFITITGELKEKNRLQMENDFKPIFDEYILKLRANEHEYKNHLNTIYSIINISDEKDIKENINKYIGNIKDNNHLNNLLYIDNTILKAVLYSKMSVAEEKGIEIIYDVTDNLNDIKLDQMDLVVLLSNLLNNAIEAVEAIKDPWIYVNIESRYLKPSKKHYISVSNKIINKIEALNAINKGITTKGANRGYGLYNIKKIVNKSKGDILIEALEDCIKIEVFI